MELRVENIAPIRVAYLRAIGPYQETFPVIWPKVRTFAAKYKLADAKFISIAHNNPRTTPPEQIVGDACVSISDSFVLTETADEADFHIQTIPGGKHVIAEYVGPYEGLSKAWAEFCDVLIPGGGHRTRPGLQFETYRTDPRNTEPKDAVTDLHMPVV